MCPCLLHMPAFVLHDEGTRRRRRDVKEKWKDGWLGPERCPAELGTSCNVVRPKGEFHKFIAVPRLSFFVEGEGFRRTK